MSHGCRAIEIERLELAVCMVAPPAPVAYGLGLPPGGDCRCGYDVAATRSGRSSSSSTQGRPPILPPGASGALGAEGAPHGLLLWGGGFVDETERRGGGSNHQGGAAQCGRGRSTRRGPPFQEPPSHFLET
jgi:hypothetical protein